MRLPLRQFLLQAKYVLVEFRDRLDPSLEVLAVI
jgi:hypothetical protein